MLAKFAEAGGRGKPTVAEVGVCWAADERQARRIAHEWWPTAAMESSLSWELPLPKHFQDVATLVTEDAVAETITCGPDVDRHVEAITKYVDAGYEQVCVHQIGPDQQGFLKFYEREVLPRLGTVRGGLEARRMHFAESKGGRPMPRCDVCGNDYDQAFQVTVGGATHTFDSFECAIHRLAPACEHCGCKIVGHGVEAGSRVYCCASCARHSGVKSLKDRATEAA